MKSNLAMAFVLLSTVCAASTQNITLILNGFPELSVFNSYLTQTKLADEINSRSTITVLTVDNAAMSKLTGLNLGLATVKNVLSLHVLLDYFDPPKLREITNRTVLTTTLLQTTGTAQGETGFLNITDLKGGAVGFGSGVQGSGIAATLVKSVKELPYNLSVLQISNLIIPSSLQAASPPASDLNISSVLLNAGHKVFAQLISTTGVLKTYEDDVTGGLTLFAPSDDAFNGLLPKLNKLSSAQKVSTLQFHALPRYSPLGTLKTTKGNLSTLASGYSLTVSSNGDTVTLNTGFNKAAITSTILDEQPVAIFSIDKILEPPAVFASAPGPAVASAPAPSARVPAPAHPHAPTPAPIPPTHSPTHNPPPVPPVSAPSPSRNVSVHTPSPRPSPPTLAPSPLSAKAPSPSRPGRSSGSAPLGAPAGAPATSSEASAAAYKTAMVNAGYAVVTVAVALAAAL